MRELKLTDVLDIEVLQDMQNSFSDFTGMAALTTDAKGVPITEGSNFSELCMSMTRKSELGCKRCEECDKMGALTTLLNGKSTVYRCHMGLIDYAAPIMVEGKFMGSIIGGQVTAEPLDEAAIRKQARELGIDEDLYYETSQKVKIVEQSTIEKAAEYLTRLAEIMSKMAYNNYLALENSKKLERAARAQTSFIIDMNSDIQSTIRSILDQVEAGLRENDQQKIQDVMKKFISSAPEWLNSIEETVQYAKMTDGEIELNETKYDVQQLFDGIEQYVSKQMHNDNVSFELHISQDMPKIAFGDAGRMEQIVNRLTINLGRIMKKGRVMVDVTCQQQSYATMFEIFVSCDENVLQTKDIDYINHLIDNNNLYLGQGQLQEGEEFSISVIAFLIRQLSGQLHVQGDDQTGTKFTILLPQLKIE